MTEIADPAYLAHPALYVELLYELHLQIRRLHDLDFKKGIGSSKNRVPKIAPIINMEAEFPYRLLQLRKEGGKWMYAKTTAYQTLSQSYSIWGLWSCNYQSICYTI